MTRRVSCVGGGPGGLFFALLAKQADPGMEVTVFERNRAEDTFGFGVVFSDATLSGIDAADPVLRTALTEHGVHWDPIEVRLKGERVLVAGMGMAAVARQTLLGLLQARAAEVGVDLRFSTEADPDALLADGVDLVVAADGANSAARSRYAEDFGPSVATAAAKFIWFGTTYQFDGLTFVHEDGPHGVFAVHGYPIGGGVSTFIVETDDASWRAAGLDRFDLSQPPGVSDTHTQAYLQKLFADQIDGHPLLANNSRWGSFRTLRTRSWSRGRLALLGDAAHTAHFSVGSGTKMAMEDAIALAAALRDHPDDVGVTLATYESERRPQVAKIQDSAQPSLSWWEHFGRYHRGFEPWQFAYHFMTRSLTEAKLATRDPAFVSDCNRRWARDHGAAPLDSAFHVPGWSPLPDRVGELRGTGDIRSLALGPWELPLRLAQTSGAWGLWIDTPESEDGLPAALAVIDAAAGSVGQGPQAVLEQGARQPPVLVAASGGPPALRRLVAEHARLERGLPAVLVAGADDARATKDWAHTEVLSGRADLVAGTPAQAAQWRCR